MQFYIGFFFWLLMAAVLTAGIVMATSGSFLVLGIGMLAFVGAFIRYGCLHH